MNASLEAWLARLEALTPEARVELGLERVRAVLERLPGARPVMPVVSVAGTNGKGSVVAFLEGIFGAAGHRVMAYTSPHLVEFSERFRIDGRGAGERELVEALSAVERARGGRDLTYFEHLTLAALWLAARHRPDVLVLEVGLGGRLDAVNVVEADLAVITSIGLDHREWLGRTRSAIAREKAGIARPGRPVVLADKRRPAALDEALAAIGAGAIIAGRDFDWRWGRRGLVLKLPGERIGPVEPGIPGRHQAANAAAAAAAARALKDRLSVPPVALAEGLRAARLPGRCQRLRDGRLVVDVAHNPQAARALARELRGEPGPVRAVFAALADKDAAGMVRALRGVAGHWYVAGLPGPRGMDAGEIFRRTRAAAAPAPVEALESVAEALERALEAAGDGERVVVFGSFLTAAEALKHQQASD